MEKRYIYSDYELLEDRMASCDDFSFVRLSSIDSAVIAGRSGAAHGRNEDVIDSGWYRDTLVSLLSHDDGDIYFGIPAFNQDRAAFYCFASRFAGPKLTFSDIFLESRESKILQSARNSGRDIVAIGSGARSICASAGVEPLGVYSIDSCGFNSVLHLCDELVSRINNDFGDRSNIVFAVDAGSLSTSIVMRLYQNNKNNCYLDFHSDFQGEVSCNFPGSPTAAQSPSSSWMPNLSTTSFDVSVVLTSYKKPEALLRQFESIVNQTLRPKEILLFQDGIEGCYSIQYSDDLLRRFDGYRISEKNCGVWERFRYARECHSTFICIFDDDTIPGSRWLENCHANILEHDGVYGTIGIVLERPDGYPKQGGYYRVGWDAPNEKTMKVDFVGHSWFFNKSVLNYMFDSTDCFQEMKYVAEDMCLSVKSNEHGVMTYVPPHPFSDRELWGSEADSALHYGRSGVALSMNPNNLKLMSNAIEMFRLAGHKFICESDPNLVSEQKKDLSCYSRRWKLQSFRDKVSRFIFRCAPACVKAEKHE